MPSVAQQREELDYSNTVRLSAYMSTHMTLLSLPFLLPSDLPVVPMRRLQA